jgi:hypothetical protein
LENDPAKMRENYAAVNRRIRIIIVNTWKMNVVKLRKNYAAVKW